MTPTNDSALFVPEATHYGIPVCHLGEEGDMLALGHHRPLRVVAAFNRHARVYVGLTNLFDDRSLTAADVLKDIRAEWALFRKPDPEQGDDPGFEWYVEWVDGPDVPGAVAVTLLDA